MGICQPGLNYSLEDETERCVRVKKQWAIPYKCQTYHEKNIFTIHFSHTDSTDINIWWFKNTFEGL